LPRVCQLLFWFLKEVEVFTVLSVLVAESKERQSCEKFLMHFPFGLAKYKEIVGIAMLMIGNVRSKPMKLIIKDAVFNFMVGFISPAFYPLVLMQFMIDGVGGLLKLVVAYFQLTIQLLEPLRESTEPAEIIIQTAKNICKNAINIASLLQVIDIQSVYCIDVSSGFHLSHVSMNSVNDLVEYTPVFQGTSKIIESSEELRAICAKFPAYLLNRSLQMVFSIKSMGIDIKKFVEAWKSIQGPLVMLIETYKRKVIGLFLDRNEDSFSQSQSFLFVLRPDTVFYPHVAGERVDFSAEYKTGLTVTEGKTNEIDKKCLLTIYGSLSAGLSFKSTAFSSPQLFKTDEFMIFDIELLKIT
jgi:hypothetical protein